MFDTDSKMEKILDHYEIPIMSTKEKIICPFHGDINASLLVDIEKDSWFCFGCQEGGDAFAFHKKYQSMLDKGGNELETLRSYNSIIANRPVKKSKLKHQKVVVKDKAYFKQKLIEAKDSYYGLKKVDWYEDDSELISYMKWRGFTRESLSKAKAKYTYQDNYPIVFPILDNGRFKGWLSRTFDPEMAKKRKYLYNEGFRRRYALSGVYKSKIVTIVEGHFDMLKARQLGLKNVVAILGWKITDYQVEKLRDAGVELVISALDNDTCGKKGTKYLTKFFDVIEFPYPEGVKDMGDITQKQFNVAKRKLKTKINKWRNE